MSKPDLTTGAANGGAGPSPFEFAALVKTFLDELYAAIGDGTDLSSRLTTLKDLSTTGFLHMAAGSIVTRSFADTADVVWTNADGAAGSPSALLAALPSVSAGQYSLPTLTVDAKGRVTSIASGAAGGGEANLGESLGAGEPVFAQKSGATLQFKSMVQGANITITSDDDTITIAGDAGSTPNAGDVGVTPTGGIAATNVQAALAELDTEKAALAHTQAATTITYSAGGTISATTVQAAIEELDAEKAASSHTHPASVITFSPTGSIAATTVQTAIAELDTTLGIGAGSGVDADLLDGQQGSAYVLKTGATLTGPLAVPSGATGANVPQAQEVALLTGAAFTGGISTTGTVIANGTGVAKAGMPLLTETTTTRTLALGDNGGYLRFTSASATTVTVPPNASVPFPTGAEVMLVSAAAGVVTVAAGAGVTINSLEGNLALSGRYAGAMLKKVSTDAWDLVGGLA